MILSLPPLIVLAPSLLLLAVGVAMVLLEWKRTIRRSAYQQAARAWREQLRVAITENVALRVQVDLYQQRAARPVLTPSSQQGVDSL